MSEEKNNNINLEDAFQNLFRTSVSGSGEEELLRIASTYSLQLTAGQIRLLLFLEYRSQQIGGATGVLINSFVKRWLELKQNNNSDIFVMKALEFISLRKFLGESSFKVNIDK